jgi:NADPH:quinone reductase-like Zn-dependent oxidoreductase
MEHPMRALVHDPDAPHGLRLGEAPDPELGPSDALVRVAATSLNFGEVAFLRERVAPGAVAGWDASGTVVAAAADGSGPPTDARVATFGWSGAWAQRRAVDTGELAVLPDAVDFGAAAALPVAGVTALRAVRRLGSVVGRRVLITGASGGVGRFAVQLAARAGAHVVASVGSPARGEGLAELGAHEVVVGLGELAEPVHAALDNVGGQTLAEILALLAPGGYVLSVGMASLQPTTIDFEQMRMRAGGSRIEAFTVGPGFGADLPYLVSLLEAGELDPQIGWRGSWDRAGEAADALIGRRVRGKAILEVAP